MKNFDLRRLQISIIYLYNNGQLKKGLKLRKTEDCHVIAASSTGFSKAKRARILTREEGSRASAEPERGNWKRARSLPVSPLAPAFLNN